MISRKSSATVSSDERARVALLDAAQHLRLALGR